MRASQAASELARALYGAVLHHLDPVRESSMLGNRVLFPWAVATGSWAGSGSNGISVFLAILVAGYILGLD